MSRFDSLDSDTIDTLLEWYRTVNFEGQTYVSDDALADELEQTIRSRFKEHAYVPAQYSRHCVHHEHGVDCHLTRPEHEGLTPA